MSIKVWSCSDFVIHVVLLTVHGVRFIASLIMYAAALISWNCKTFGLVGSQLASNWVSDWRSVEALSSSPGSMVFFDCCQQSHTSLYYFQTYCVITPEPNMSICTVSGGSWGLGALGPAILWGPRQW